MDYAQKPEKQRMLKGEERFLPLSPFTYFTSKITPLRYRILAQAHQ